MVHIWGEIYKQLYVARETGLMSRLEGAVEELVMWRSQLRSGTLTQEEAAEVAAVTPSSATSAKVMGTFLAIAPPD